MRFTVTVVDPAAFDARLADAAAAADAATAGGDE
jgi:hypothetical protein